MQFSCLFIVSTQPKNKLTSLFALEHRQKQLRNAYYKITPKLLFEYQCTSGKFIRLPNRIESKKIDSVARIESNRIETYFCPNWNALLSTSLTYMYSPVEGPRPEGQINSVSVRGLLNGTTP